ncbi:unnamed protein product [Cochlearia groenlandica]
MHICVMRTSFRWKKNINFQEEVREDVEEDFEFIVEDDVDVKDDVDVDDDDDDLLDSRFDYCGDSDNTDSDDENVVEYGDIHKEDDV